VLYQTPREKKPSSASTKMTIKMIQRIPMSALLVRRTTKKTLFRLLLEGR
jgi:hypothetical protein